MSVDLKVSRAFIEGTKYPRRIIEKNSVYIVAPRRNTVKKAWENTGYYLQKAINDYGRKGKGY